MVTRERDRKRD